MIALVALVLGGLFIGWFSPTEAGGVGAFGAILFSLIRKRLNWKKFKNACFETLQTTGMIYCILIGAFIFNYFIAVSTLPFKLSAIVGGLDLPPLAVMGIILLVYLVLGCFIDAAAMVLLTIPVFFPLATGLGFHPIWFGIILVRVVEMAMITPPIGINVYVIKGVAGDVPIQTIFRGIVPFLVADVFEIILLLFVPQIILFLPTVMH